MKNEISSGRSGKTNKSDKLMKCKFTYRHEIK